MNKCPHCGAEACREYSLKDSPIGIFVATEYQCGTIANDRKSACYAIENEQLRERLARAVELLGKCSDYLLDHPTWNGLDLDDTIKDLLAETEKP